jgi:alkylated DNA repair dioxygenase AlkB
MNMLTIGKVENKVQISSGRIDKEVADEMYKKLRDEVPWTNGIRSRHGVSRLQYGVSGQSPIDGYIQDVVSDVCRSVDFPGFTTGIYLNYYRNGRDYTPSHKHENTYQMIISLGETRTLMIGKKGYDLSSGDVIVFGEQMHSIPKSDTEGGRISIAVFGIPIDGL